MATVIIGAGVGGLSSAIALSAAGEEVTVLEKQPGAGGKMLPVELDGLSFDSGPTVLTMRWVFDELFQLAGSAMDKRLTLRPLATLVRHYWTGGTRLDLFADPRANLDAIGAFAGKAEAEGYRAFMAAARRTYQSLLQPFIKGQRPTPWGLPASMPVHDVFKINPFESLWHAIGRYFKDARLQQLFGRYATYCGSSPFRAPATLMLVADVEASGVWRVDGGMAALAKALEAEARRLGVTFHFASEAQRIEMAHAKVTAVIDHRGQRHTCSSVVVNADSAAVAEGLFGSDIKSTVSKLRADTRSLSAQTWCALTHEEGVPLEHHTVFFSDDYAQEFAALAHSPAPDPTVYICDQSLGRKLILVNAPADAADSPPDIDDRMLRRLSRSGLRLEFLGRSRLRRGPKDFATLYPATMGALYGRASHGWMSTFLRPQARTKMPGILSGGREHASGPGCADGGTGGPAGRGSPVARPGFDAPVGKDGYRWWYIDASSDDGTHGLTIIGFVGSVFSPYYAWARRSGSASPENHCAINIALYGSQRRWALTERGERRVARTPERFRVGPSSMTWQGGKLSIEIDERCAPLPFPLRGRVTLLPGLIYDAPVALDADRKHHWQAVAPEARVSVEFEAPGLSWSGPAYHDMNWGEEPLERAFTGWTWLRARSSTGTQVLYDLQRRDGSQFCFGRIFEQGRVSRRTVPPRHALRRGLWGMTREVASDRTPRLIATLEDAPFYTRNHVEVTLNDETCEAFHESLSLRRLVNPVVQLMLPVRMPRLA